MMNNELTCRAAIEIDVNGLNVRENRGVGNAGILEVKRPFHSGEVFIRDGDAADN